MRECLICGAREHVQSCEKIQLCTRCAGVLWEVLQPKLHPEKVEQGREMTQDVSESVATHPSGVFGTSPEIS